MRSQQAQQALKLGLVNTELAQMQQGVDQIVKISARDTLCSADQMGLFSQRQPPGVTRMRTFNYQCKRDRLALGVGCNRRCQPMLTVDAADLFALAQIVQRLRGSIRLDPE